MLPQATSRAAVRAVLVGFLALAGLAAASAWGLTAPAPGLAPAAHAAALQDPASSPDTLLLLTGIGAAGEYHLGGSWVFTETTLASANYMMGLASPDPGSAVALQVAADGYDTLQYNAWNAGTWLSARPLGSGLTGRSGPALDGAAGLVQAAYQGPDFRYYYAACAGHRWSPQAEPIGSPQASGPNAPALAARGADAVVAYAGNDNGLYTQDRIAGTWSAPQPVAGAVDVSVPPSLVALVGTGPDALLVYAGSDLQIRYSFRTNGTWSAPAVIPGASTDWRLTLTALPGGSAFLAYVGTDNQIHYTIYNTIAWQPAQALPWTTHNPRLPAVAPALDLYHDAEMVYADDTGVYYTRTHDNLWTVPVQLELPPVNLVKLISYRDVYPERDGDRHAAAHRDPAWPPPLRRDPQPRLLGQ